MLAFIIIYLPTTFKFSAICQIWLFAVLRKIRQELNLWLFNTTFFQLLLDILYYISPLSPPVVRPYSFRCDCEWLLKKNSDSPFHNFCLTITFLFLKDTIEKFPRLSIWRPGETPINFIVRPTLLIWCKLRAIYLWGSYSSKNQPACDSPIINNNFICQFFQ